MNNVQMPPGEWERWRGEIDAFANESRNDRRNLHDEMRRYSDRAEERHVEILGKLGDAADIERNLVAVIRSEAAAAASAAHRRAEDAHGRIDRWEARAEGASWVSKWLPSGIAGAIGAAATYFATGKWPSGH
jgi:hypothetical protein